MQRDRPSLPAWSSVDRPEIWSSWSVRRLCPDHEQLGSYSNPRESHRKRRVQTNGFSYLEAVVPPRAPKSGVLSLGSPSFSISFLKTNELEQNLVVPGCREMWLRMRRVPPIFPSAKNKRIRYHHKLSLIRVI